MCSSEMHDNAAVTKPFLKDQTLCVARGIFIELEMRTHAQKDAAACLCTIMMGKQNKTELGLTHKSMRALLGTWL